MYNHPVGRSTHLVVKENADYCCHHTQYVCGADWVAQHQQRDANDHNPLGGIGYSVAERADKVEHTEGNDILGKVAEAADEQEEKGAGPLWNIGLWRSQ